MARKRVAVAYLLWLVGFWMGLHHLYLRRPRAAFLHAATLNMCGLGWWRDLLCMPSFVAQANRDAEFVALKRIEQRFHRAPPVSWLVVWMQLVLAHVFGSIASSLIPREAYEWLYELLFATGAAWGIWFTGVALDEQVASPFQRVGVAVIGVVMSAYCAFATDGAGVTHPSYRQAKGFAVLLGCAVFWYSRSWHFVEVADNECVQAAITHDPSIQAEDATESDGIECPEPKRPGWWRTLLVYYALLGAFAGALATAVFFHGEVTIIVNGQARTHSFPEAAENVLRSEELFRHFYDLFADILSQEAEADEPTFEHSWRDFQSKIDISGRKRHLKVLGLHESSGQQGKISQAEIKNAYKRLALQWHPDKYAGDDAVHAQKMFYKVQEAYKKLQRMSDSESERASQRRYSSYNGDEL